MNVYTNRNESLVISDSAISSGGEGEIHSVISKPSRFGAICVKIYFKNKRNATLERKLKYMAENPPQQISSAYNMICWPLDVIYDKQKHFIGFIMPLAFGNSEPLIILTVKNLAKKLNPTWSEKFDRRLGASSMIARLKLICNIAIPIHILHSTNKYVFRDFKPENVLVTSDGKVSLVDMDSIQIAEGGRMLFAGTGMTPNYMPPEHYNKNVGKVIDVPIERSWDYFSVGVVFYQIVFGLHPYVVTPVVSMEANCNEIYQNIAENLFPFGENSFKVSDYPPPHNNFTHIPFELQDLFKKAFSSNSNARPTLETWVKTIKEIIKKTPVPPKPLLGTISVQSVPSGASVKMDNCYIGITPITFKAIVGFHRIDVSHNYMMKTIDSVEVRKDETTSVTAQVGNQTNQTVERQNNVSSSSNSGCLWFFLMVFVISITILIRLNANEDNNYTIADIYGEDSAAVEVVDSAEYVVEEVVVSETLNVSNDDIYFEAEGGAMEIRVYSEYDWSLGIWPDDWVHISISGNVLTICADEYWGDTDRYDWFTIVAGDAVKRIDITQSRARAE